jgi:murein L,D-transpeptidase YcbB/YkuD
MSATPQDQRPNRETSRQARQQASHRALASLPTLLYALRLFSLLAIIASCTARAPGDDPSSRAGEARPASVFQHHLDRLGVSIELPATGKAILVNVPAFELIAFADANPVFRSRVIVGAPWHPTPLLETHTTAVRFRPTWRPTPAMVASGEYPDRIWPPGRKNPLGLAAIRLQPGLLIYLHDTNRRDLFRRDRRALSHGCIRVQRWDELAAWVLDLDLDEVHRLANGRRTFDMPTRPIPVTIGYFTVFPDDAGQVVRYEDLYGRHADTEDQVPQLRDIAGQTSDAPTCAAAMPAG